MRPIWYDLNQIPYDYTVKVTKRFKGLNLIDRVPEEGLQIAKKKKTSKNQRRKGNIYPSEYRVPKNSKEK